MHLGSAREEGKWLGLAENAELVMGAISDRDSTAGPIDAHKIEKSFLLRHCSKKDGSGEGPTIPPLTTFTAFIPRMLTKRKSCAELLLLDQRRRCPGGGDSSEVESSVYTDDDIEVGESATDWQYIKYRDIYGAQSTSMSAGRALGADVNLDEHLQPPVLSSPFQLIDSKTVGEWADQLPSIPQRLLIWNPQPSTQFSTYTSLLLGGLALVIIQAFYRRWSL